MPMYKFEVRTPTQILLTKGVALADNAAARAEAAKRIGALLQDQAGQLWVDQDWQMDVTNAQGLILYTVSIVTMRTAATQGESG